MKLYVVTMELQENLYTDCMVKARTKFGAKRKAKKYFLNKYPEANKHIKFKVNSGIPMKED